MQDLTNVDAMATYAERIQKLEFVHALHDLRAEFHRCVNNEDWNGLGLLFTDDALLDYGQYGQAGGASGIQDYYSRLAPKIAEFRRGATAIALKNFPHGHQVHLLDEHNATGTSFFEEKIRFNDESELYCSAGQFSDTYVRRDGKWQFSKIELDHYWVVPNNEGWRWPW